MLLCDNFGWQVFDSVKPVHCQWVVLWQGPTLCPNTGALFGNMLHSHVMLQTAFLHFEYAHKFLDVFLAWWIISETSVMTVFCKSMGHGISFLWTGTTLCPQLCLGAILWLYPQRPCFNQTRLSIANAVSRQLYAIKERNWAGEADPVFCFALFWSWHSGFPSALSHSLRKH